MHPAEDRALLPAAVAAAGTSNHLNMSHAVQSGAAWMGAAALPLAAINWENFTPGAITKGFTTFRDRVYYGDVLPPVGSQTLSYARMLEMLSQRKVRG